jgi:hypothetical protein
MMRVRTIHFAWWIVCGVASLTSCSGGVIGATCGSQYEECNHRCVPIGTCHPNDGAGDTLAFDASTRDGNGADGIATSDGASGDSPFGDGQLGDGQSGEPPPDGGWNNPDSGSGEGGTFDFGLLDDGCAPPYNQVTGCGSCGVTCQSEQVCRAFPSGVGTDGGPGWACTAACGPGQTDCFGTCTDVESDPNNCGTCGNVCASGICAAGVCSDRKPGHVVVIGHDYSNWPGNEPTILLVNAVLSATRATRIVGFEYAANPASVGIVKSILQSESALPSSYTPVTAWSALAPYLGNQTDVVLIYDQWNSDSTEVLTQAQQFSANFDSYVAAGGTVVVLASGSHASGTNSDMPTLLTAGDLLDVTQASTDNLAGQNMQVVDYNDLLASNMTEIYSAPSYTVSFNVTDTRAFVIVIENQIDSTAVVIHRSVYSGDQ